MSKISAKGLFNSIHPCIFFMVRCHISTLKTLHIPKTGTHYVTLFQPSLCTSQTNCVVLFVKPFSPCFSASIVNMKGDLKLELTYYLL